MEDKETRDFIVKFNELTPGNQKYIVAIQQALAFAQWSSESEKMESKNGNRRSS